MLVRGLGGTVTNRATLQQIAADTAQHRAALARLDQNLEVMGSLVGGIRDRAEETAASALETRRRLEEEIARVATVAAGPGERFAALEARIEGLERQIAAALQSLAPRPEAPQMPDADPDAGRDHASRTRNDRCDPGPRQACRRPGG